MERCGRLTRLLTEVRQITPSSLLTYLLFCLFGVGSWLAINGVFAELPLLVVNLPECYNLSVIFAVVIQIANVGPILYTIVKFSLGRCQVRALHVETAAVYVLLGIGLVTCVLLAFTWDKTAYVIDQQHSVALIVLTFFLALVDCTTTLVFIPFLKHFPARYISALYIGEGMSGVIPSVVALSQGFVNESLECTQGYLGVDRLGINFSPSVYFVFLALLTVVCGLAFTAIVTLPSVRRQMIPASSSVTLYVGSAVYSPSSATHSQKSRVSHEEEEEEEEEVNEGREGREHSVDTEDDVIEEDTGISTPLLQSIEDSRINNKSDSQPSRHSWSLFHCRLARITWNNLQLFVCIFLISFISNGALISISTFIFKPYGNRVYDVAINLRLFVLPLGSLLYVFVSHKSEVLITLLTSLATLLALYLLVIALQYPDPFLRDHTAGKTIVVSGLLQDMHV